MSRINVTLYNKEGSTPVGINPATVASQVEIASETGTDSTVEAEIVELRGRVLTSHEVIAALPVEEWIFTLVNGSTVTKKVPML